MRTCIGALLIVASSRMWSQSSLDFVTANRSLATLPEEMSSYYEKLASEDKLPVRWIRDDVGLEMRHIAYGVGLLRNSGRSEGMPAKFDLILCKLNRHVCRIDDRGKAVWRNGKNSRLCIPAVAWTDALYLTSTREHSEDPLPLLEQRFGTCTLIGPEKCEAKVDRLRERKDSQGWMEIPVLAQGALKLDGIPITECRMAPETGDFSSQLSEKGVEYLRDRLQSTGLIGNAISTDTGRELAALSHVNSHDLFGEQVLRLIPLPPSRTYTNEAGQLEEVLIGENALTGLLGNNDAMFALQMAQGTQPAAMDRDEIAEAISEELSTPIISEALKDSDLNRHRVTDGNRGNAAIMILDFPMDECHPLIRHAIVLEAEACEGRPTLVSYPVLAEALPQRKHHGTHIAGLVAGGQGVGMYPTAKLQFFSLVRSDQGDQTDFTYDLQQAFMGALNERDDSIRVTNLSVDFHLERDTKIHKTLEETIGRYEILFVAAAGNESGSLDGVCNIVPACLDAKQRNNLMVVGGAKRVDGSDWALQEQSRFGQRVDILAPADNILSIASGKNSALVRMSGTSQATALVSSVAAMLFDAPEPTNSPWRPVQIKNRLKATSRIIQALQEKTSGGILAADQALDVDSQYLTFDDDRPDTPDNPIKGRLVEVVAQGNDKKDSFFPMTARGLTDPNVSFCRMYRFQKHPDGSVTFFYEPSSTESLTRWTAMSRYTQGEIGFTTKQLIFTSDAKPNEYIAVPINKVIDFVDKFSGERACGSAN